MLAHVNSDLRVGKLTQALAVNWGNAAQHYWPLKNQYPQKKSRHPELVSGSIHRVTPTSESRKVDKVFNNQALRLSGKMDAETSSA
jgi:hypothetical protein